MQTGICVIKDLSGRYIPLTYTNNEDLANIFMHINRNNLEVECLLDVGERIKLHVNKDKKEKVEDVDFV